MIVQAERTPRVTALREPEHAVRIVAVYLDLERFHAARMDGRNVYLLDLDGTAHLMSDHTFGECSRGAAQVEPQHDWTAARWWWWCREHRLSVGLACQPRLFQRWVAPDGGGAS